MKRKRFEIDRCDLAAYKTRDLKRMEHWLDRQSELVSEAIMEWEEDALADLDDAVADELSKLSAVVNRIGRRIAKELASRK